MCYLTNAKSVLEINENCNVGSRNNVIHLAKCKVVINNAICPKKKLCLCRMKIKIAVDNEYVYTISKSPAEI